MPQKYKMHAPHKIEMGHHARYYRGGGGGVQPSQALSTTLLEPISSYDEYCHDAMSRYATNGTYIPTCASTKTSRHRAYNILTKHSR